MPHQIHVVPVKVKREYGKGLFRCVCKIAESDYLLLHVCRYVCLSAWYNSAPTGLIFMKLDCGVFFENLSRKVKFS
jgi:hypothetical protein